MTVKSTTGLRSDGGMATRLVVAGDAKSTGDGAVSGRVWVAKRKEEKENKIK